MNFFIDSFYIGVIKNDSMWNRFIDELQLQDLIVDDLYKRFLITLYLISIIIINTTLSVLFFNVLWNDLYLDDINGKNQSCYQYTTSSQCQESNTNQKDSCAWVIEYSSNHYQRYVCRWTYPQPSLLMVATCIYLNIVISSIIISLLKLLFIRVLNAPSYTDVETEYMHARVMKKFVMSMFNNDANDDSNGSSSSNGGDNNTSNNNTNNFSNSNQITPYSPTPNIATRRAGINVILSTTKKFKTEAQMKHEYRKEKSRMKRELEEDYWDKFMKIVDSIIFHYKKVGTETMMLPKEYDLILRSKIAAAVDNGYDNNSISLREQLKFYEKTNNIGDQNLDIYETDEERNKREQKEYLKDKESLLNQGRRVSSIANEGFKLKIDSKLKGSSYNRAERLLKESIKKVEINLKKFRVELDINDRLDFDRQWGILPLKKKIDLKPSDYDFINYIPKNTT
jgi:hypothetical protein